MRALILCVFVAGLLVTGKGIPEHKTEPTQIKTDVEGPIFWKPEQDTIRSKKYLFPTRRPWDSHKPKQIR